MASISSNLNTIQEKAGATAAAAAAQQVVSKEYYVKVPKTKKRYHALKFHTSNVDLATWTKVGHFWIKLIGCCQTNCIYFTKRLKWLEM